MKALQWLCMFEGVGNNQITDLIKRVQSADRLYWIIAPRQRTWGIT